VEEDMVTLLAVVDCAEPWQCHCLDF